MKNRTVLIYGASGHGKVVIDIVEKEGKYTIAGLLDDNLKMWGKDFCGYPVVGGFDVFMKGGFPDHAIILAVGDNKSRKMLWEKIRPLGSQLIHSVHPSAQLGKNVRIGLGTVIMANVVINSGTKIGENVIINTGATVDHDCFIGDYVHISPGTHLSGNVEIGNLTHVGIGVSVVPGIKIGEGVIIGAGAVVLEDIPNDVTAAGVPAKVIKKH